VGVQHRELVEGHLPEPGIGPVRSDQVQRGHDRQPRVNERVKRDQGLGDFADPEQFVPAAPLSRQWETSATMNGAWGYNAGSENSYKPAKSMIQELVQVVSRDGNYLLNIGPRGDGTALDNGNTTTEGGTVIQWTDNGGTPQRWQLVQVG
jgi:hypothetical protein